MNENIDLTKILKNCPKGTKFYSSIFGDLLYSCMHLRLAYQKITFIKPNTITSVDYYRDGKYCQGQGECTIFPSKDQRDWNKFTAPWLKKEKFDPKTLKLHDKVLVRDEFTYSWASAYFYHIKEDSDYPYMTTRSAYRYCIPYNNDTKHLDGRKEQAPDFYRYWED